jgi:hypothetical protein
MITPPPPGISAIGEGGERTPVDSGVRKPRKKGSSRGDVIARPERFRKVDPSAPPPGTQRVQPDVLEAPVGLKPSARVKATFRSCDGEVYSVRTHDDKGKPLSYRETLCLFLAMREVVLGGSPFPIFDAFRLKMSDLDGKPIYPVPTELMERMTGRAPLPIAEGVEEEKGFSLGE